VLYSAKCTQTAAQHCVNNSQKQYNIRNSHFQIPPSKSVQDNVDFSGCLYCLKYTKYYYLTCTASVVKLMWLNYEFHW